MIQFISINDKKAQAWSLDLVIAGVIFLAGVITLYIYAINYSSQSQSQLEELFFEADVAAELTLSGSNLGILSENKVNQTKLESFNSNYPAKKATMGLRHDFYFTLGNLTLGGAPAAYVGQQNTSDVEHSIQITRITIYKNKPTKFQLYVWSNE